MPATMIRLPASLPPMSGIHLILEISDGGAPKRTYSREKSRKRGETSMFKNCSLALITFLILFAGQAAAECEHVYGNMNMIECEKNEYDKANKQLQELIQSIKRNLH